VTEATIHQVPPRGPRRVEAHPGPCPRVEMGQNPKKTVQPGCWSQIAGSFQWAPKKNVQGSRYDSATRLHADVRFATGRSGSTVYRSPPLPFGAWRVIASDTSSSDSASRRSRNLDTAFRSLTTTLSPPLQGQRSRPAPSFPHRKLPRIRSIPTAPLRSVSRPKQGGINAGNPLLALASNVSALSRASTPLRVVLSKNPPDHSVQPDPSRKARLAGRPLIPRSLPLPLLNSAAYQRVKLASSRLAYRSVNPGTKSRIIKT
jgi:hypothetical protein